MLAGVRRPREISGSRDWRPLWFYWARPPQSCFNIQIVICHPPHAGIVSPVSPPSAGLLSPATSDYEHLELTGKSHNTAGHVLQVHVSPVQRVTTQHSSTWSGYPILKGVVSPPVWVMRRWGLLWPALSQSSRSRRTIWLASYGLFCHPAAASANSSSSYNYKHCLCGWYMFVRAWNEGSRRLRKDFTITEKVPTWAFSWLKPPK